MSRQVMRSAGRCAAPAGLTGLMRPTRVLFSDPSAGFEAVKPKWQREVPEPMADLTPKPFYPDDSGRDNSVKYSAEEVNARYGRIPDPRRAFVREGDGFINVRNVPEDIYSFGQEGDTVTGMDIFKDQTPPTIRPMEDYPFLTTLLAQNLGVHTLRTEYDLMQEEGKMTPELQMFRQWKLSEDPTRRRAIFKHGIQRPKASGKGRGKK